MKHLFSIQNDAPCKKKSIYCICDVPYICSIFFCDGRYCDGKNVMDATSLINFGKISIENL